MDLISIIIPVYNGEKYLEDCLDSIIHQSYQDIEVLLIDDGSTDSTKEICCKYADLDSRIRYIYQDNSGVASARMNGLNLAKADLVMFVDADDSLKQDCLSVLKQLIDEKKVDIVCCGSEDIRDGHIEVFNCYEDKYIKDKDIIMKDYFDNVRYTYAIWGKLYRKEVFNNIQFPNLKYGEDTLLNAYVFQAIKDLFLSSYVGYEYRMLPNSSSQKINNYKKSIDLIRRDKGIYDICEQMNSAYLGKARRRYVVSISTYVNTVGQSSEEALKDRDEILIYIKQMLKIKRLEFKYKVKFMGYMLWGKQYLSIVNRGN